MANLKKIIIIFLEAVIVDVVYYEKL